MKFQSYFRLLLAGVLLLGCSTGTKAQGPRRALYIPGSGILTPAPLDTTNSYVDLGRSLQDSLGTTSFTIELWVKMGATNSVNPAILGNKNWTSGANTGIVLSYYASTDASSGTAGANTIRFNFKPAGGTRVDYDIAFPAAIAKKWNHIAIAVDRAGSIQGYLNGVATGKAYTGTGSIAVDAGKSVADTLPLRIGTDGKPFGYRAPFNGSLDEVRIWKTVRTAAELRDNMCHTLSGTETGLLSYYRMDETSGDTIRNTASATASLFKGVIVNGCYRVGSGAPVGDTSVNLYTTSWAGKSLQIPTANRGVFTVDSFTTTGNYLHVYKINAVPDSTRGLTTYSDNNVSFGVFASADTFLYYPNYNYSNYSTAISYKKTISFFNKIFQDDNVWIQKEKLRNDTAARLIRLDSIQGTRQFFLANFISTCNIPSLPAASDVSVNSAVLAWTTGGAALWNIEYGPAGFTPGTGTKVKAVNTNPYTLSGLAENTKYDYYVQDSCAGVGASSWAGPSSFTTAIDLSGFGSGYAMHFAGNGVVGGPVQAINLGTVLKDSLAKTDFTIEMWVKVGGPNVGNPPLIADKDYVSGTNTGICLTYTASKLYGTTDAHYFRFNFMPSGGTRRDYDMRAANEFTWNHLAITVDRRGFIKGYVNGVYQLSPELSGTGSVIADSAKTLAGSMPLYLGTDGTGAYRVPFNGDMDEVRIWKSVRTETEIRDAMCHKLKGTEKDLLAYYRMDEASGTKVINTAVATAGTMDGVTLNAPGHIISPAPLGDTSVYIYKDTSWSGRSLSLNTSDRGIVTVDSIAAAAVTGVHIYSMNRVPNFTSGIAGIGTTDKCLGVFTAEKSDAAYRLQYNYTNYANAVANSGLVHVYNRPDNAVSHWAQLPALNNTTTHVISRTAPLGVRQYLLADFTAAACPAPAAVSLDHVDTATALFSWSSAAARHRVSYGPAGYDFGAAGSDTALSNKKLLTGMVSNTAYDFYVSDSCGAANSSAWVGPYYFTTKNACPDPSDVHADSITKTTIVLKWSDVGMASTGYEISWGIHGTFTDPDIGILQPATVSRYKFTGMRAKTAYDFYVRTICSSSITHTQWIGPFTFTTDSVDAPVSVAETANTTSLWSIYPNPASDRIVITLADNNAAALTAVAVYNSLGVCVHRESIQQQQHSLEINTASLPDGVYYVSAESAKALVHQKVVIRH